LQGVSLHHHSTFSFGDGFGTPAQHVERAADLGMSALALTEHGNVSSHPQLEKAALKAGIKPIFGLEAYTALEATDRRKFHLTLLAADAKGYANLMRIVSDSYVNFYQWPTVRGETLAKYAEGIICLSGCADSLLACRLLGGKTIDPRDASYKRARKQAAKFKDLFGDRYYLETQAFPELERSRTINAAWETLGAELGISLAGTQDVHYPMPDDNRMQIILHAAHRGSSSVEQTEAGWEYDIRLTHPVSDEIFDERLCGAGLSTWAATEALRNTTEIAQRCNVTLPKAGRLRYPLPDNATALDTIWQWLRDGWRYRVSHGNRRLALEKEESLARLKYEMDIIVPKDFIDYFLMVSDIVRFAKDHGVAVGPARGSAASSLVCYLLRITEVDPMQYPLMYFERFVAHDREDIPDIDLDFDSDRRGTVREYAVRKYGADRVGNISNYTKYKGKNSLDDIGRVYPKIPAVAIATVKNSLIERSGGDSRTDSTLGDSIAMFPIAQAVLEEFPDLAYAIRLEGNYRSMSTHAAGLVIANDPIAKTCALYTRVTNGVTNTVVSVDKKDAEYLGLMKVDFLALKTMSMIRDALEDAGLTLDDLYSIPMTDRKTMDAFRRNDVIGIFQFEGRATRLVNKEVKPDNFLELSDINGLSRPGPLFSGTTAEYIDIKHGNKKLEPVHPLWDEMTDFTKGQVIYQEQVLKALLEIGGLQVTRVHEIRRIIAQKLGEAQFNTSAEDWIAGAEQLHGIKREMGKFMWSKLVTSATYSFNIAHCISYSMLAFWCMWLKIHYPVQFYKAQLSVTPEEEWMRLIRDAGKHDVSVRGVDIDKSGMTWTADAKARTVSAGWRQMKGIGPSKGAAVIAWRAQVQALNLGIKLDREDLIQVNGIGPAVMKDIRSVDPQDPFGLLRTEQALQAIRKGIDIGILDLPTPTHMSDELLKADQLPVVRFLGVVKARDYKDYVENVRSRTGEAVEDIIKAMKSPNLTTFCTLQAYDEGDEDVYLRINRFTYPRLKEGLEKIVEGDIVLAIGKKRADYGARFGINLQIDNLYIIEP
jgi:DNA polymerase-3 subunit alpha